jgi:hypothetical protein
MSMGESAGLSAFIRLEGTKKGGLSAALLESLLAPQEG